MDTSKSIFLLYFRLINETFGLGLQCFLVHPSAKATILVEQQVAYGFSWTDQESGIVAVCYMEIVHGFQIHIGEDICIVYQERFVEVRSRFLDTTTRFEQLVCFVRYPNLDAEVVFLLQEVYHLLGEMMHIDDNFIYSNGFQFVDDMLQHGLACYGNKGFRHVVSKGLETSAQARCKYHCFHLLLRFKSLLNILFAMNQFYFHTEFLVQVFRHVLSRVD